MVLFASLIFYGSITSDLIDQNVWALGSFNLVVWAVATLHASHLLSRPYDPDLPPSRDFLAPLLVILVFATSIHPVTKLDEGEWAADSMAIEVFTAVRSPVTSTIAANTSLGVDVEDFHGNAPRVLFVNPVVDLHWTWLVGVLLALHAAVDLASARAPTSRVMLWVPAILVFGLSAAIARLIFDSRGRWRRQRAQREPAPPPLLQTVEF